MNRITAIMAAFLVLLLLASGFMAADNVRLSGERAAIAEELNHQHYDYAILTRKLETQQAALEALTLERDELLLQLQDHQPAPSLTGADPILADSIRQSAAALTPADHLPTPAPAAEDAPAPVPSPDEAPRSEEAMVTEDIFALATPAPTSAPAFQHAAAPLSDAHFSLLVTDVARLTRRVDALEQRLSHARMPGDILQRIREGLVRFFEQKTEK